MAENAQEPDRTSGKTGAAKWGEVVLVVAPDDITARGFINYQEARPDNQYIYKYAKTAIDLKGLRPPQVVRVERFGQWWRGRPDDFTHEVDRIIAEVESYNERIIKGSREARSGE
jgi:hypothetical protein